MRFNPSTDDVFIKRVWFAILPMAGHLHLEVEIKVLKALPGNLVLLRSHDREEQASAAKHVAGLRRKGCRHCVPRGCAEFVATLDTEEACYAQECQCVVAELGDNLDSTQAMWKVCTLRSDNPFSGLLGIRPH